MKSALEGLLIIANIIMATFLFTLIWASCARGEEYPVKVRELSLDVMKIKNNRNAYIPQHKDEFKYHMGLNWNLNITDWVRWDNKVAFNTSDSVVKEIWWEYEIGAKVVKGVEVFHYHRSEHVADEENPAGMNYPLRNYFGLRLNLLEPSK